MPTSLSVAAHLSAAHRKHLAIQTLAGTEPVSRVAAREQVSRKFLYHQKSKANRALDRALAPVQTDSAVLFYLPVTAAWLNQWVVGLILLCHRAYRGVIQLWQDLFDTSTRRGGLHTLLKAVAGQAVLLNAAQDLSPIQVGLHDEIFQGNQPVLAGLEAHSTYGYLLVEAPHRDGDTWGVHVLDANARGFKPE